MTPEAALQAQFERYRQMTHELGVMLALGLYELACEMAKFGIHRQHPHADEARVDVLLRERLKLARDPNQGQLNLGLAFSKLC
jgi:hypothetical protein